MNPSAPPMTFNRNSRGFPISGGGMVAIIIANNVATMPLKPVNHAPIGPPGASMTSLE